MTLEARLRAALAAEHLAPPTLLTGDFADLGGGPATDVAAAVLVAVTERSEPGVILTQRTETLRQHAGQIAFPGGRIDPGDSGAIAAALREAEEEIALPPRCVRVIGTADPYRTITGFAVTPVLAVVPADVPLVPAQAEVAAVFEVPLGFALDPANHRERAVEVGGKTRHYYEIWWQNRRIWGATAAMLVNLSRRLRWTA